METSRFDRLTKTLTSGGTRRGALRLLATLPVVSGLAALLDGGDVAAVNGRRRRRKTRHHHQKGDRKQNRKGKRKGNDKTKAKDEGCRAHSDCGGDALCVDGDCQACTVTCNGTIAECGSALQAALNAGGTVYVCPGEYGGGFILTTAVTVIGAGSGALAASNTILNATGDGSVVQISNGTGTVELAQVLITGGNTGGVDGAGIRHQGTTLRMTDCVVASSNGGGIFADAGSTLELTRCAVSENAALSSSGGGINTAGTTTLTDCLVEGNSANDFGGGIYVSAGLTTLAGSTEVRGNGDALSDLAGGGIYVLSGTLVIAETCLVTGNFAADGNGGGILNLDGTVTLQGADPSPIVVDNCHENCVGNVPKCAPGGTCPP